MGFCGVVEQRRELLTLVRSLPAALVLDVLPRNRMTRVGAPSPLPPQLVLRVLAFIVGRYTGIDGDAHKKGSIPCAGKRVVARQRAKSNKLGDPLTGKRSGKNRTVYPLRKIGRGE